MDSKHNKTASATDKKSFLMYTDNRSIVDKLSDEDAGKLIKAIMFYEDTQQYPDLSGAMAAVFESFKRYLDIARANHRKVSQIRSIVGKKGIEAKLSKAKQKQAIAYEKDKDKDIEYKEEEYTVDFRRLYDAYPKKKRMEEAWLEFKKITVPIDVLIKSVKDHSTTEDWKKSGGQFIPMLSNFLKDKCWTKKIENADDNWVMTGQNMSGEGVNKDNLTLGKWMKAKREREAAE